MRTWRVINSKGAVFKGGTKAQAIELAKQDSMMYLVDGVEKTVYAIPQERAQTLRIVCSIQTWTIKNSTQLPSNEDVSL